MIFLLPWQGHTLVGTTDEPCKPTFSPQPAEDQITFMIEEVNKHMHPDIKGNNRCWLCILNLEWNRGIFYLSW